MNAEALLKESLDKPDLLICTGSRLYGTERYNEQGECVSDTDLRSVLLPPLPYLISLRNFDETNGSRSSDHRIYSLHKFVSMLLKGNFQCLEMLFAPKDFILETTEIGNELLSMRGEFVSKLFYKAITGYSYSEWNKVRGKKLVPVKKTENQRQAIDLMKTAFAHVGKDILDECESSLFAGHEYIEVDSKSDVGEKRRAEYERYGYCASAASHALRVLYQCEELMRTGRMTFPRPEKDLLSRIKRGELSLGEIEATRTFILDKAQTAYEKSTLPDRPNTKPIWAWYEATLLDRVRQQL